MVLLAGVVTLWKKYFGDNKLRKCSSTGCNDEMRMSRPYDTLLDSIRNDTRTKNPIIEPNFEGRNVLKIGSKNYPLYKGYEVTTSAVKICAQDASSANLVAMIDDLGRTMNEKIAELGRTMSANMNKMNEKIADQDTQILKIRNDMEKDGNAKNLK